MQSVANKPITLSAVMLSVVAPSACMLVCLYVSLSPCPSLSFISSLFSLLFYFTRFFLSPFSFHWELKNAKDTQWISLIEMPKLSSFLFTLPPLSPPLPTSLSSLAYISSLISLIYIISSFLLCSVLSR
jgi:hypothetical protein